MKEEEILERCITAYDTLTDETRYAIYHGIAIQGDDYKIASPVMPMIGSHPTDAATALKMQWRKNRYVGIVALLDGWSYPDKIMDQTTDMTQEEFRAWYENIGPPSEHPERIEVTHAFMKFKSGKFVSYSQERNKPETRKTGAKEAHGRIPDMLEYILSY